MFILRQKYIRRLVQCWSCLNHWDILLISSLVLRGVKTSESCPRFLTTVTFDVLWFRNGAIYLNCMWTRRAPMIDLCSFQIWYSSAQSLTSDNYCLFGALIEWRAGEICWIVSNLALQRPIPSALWVKEKAAELSSQLPVKSKMADGAKIGHS